MAFVLSAVLCIVSMELNSMKWNKKRAKWFEFTNRPTLICGLFTLFAFRFVIAHVVRSLSAKWEIDKMKWRQATQGKRKKENYNDWHVIHISHHIGSHLCRYFFFLFLLLVSANFHQRSLRNCHLSPISQCHRRMSFQFYVWAMSEYPTSKEHNRKSKCRHVERIKAMKTPKTATNSDAKHTKWESFLVMQFFFYGSLVLFCCRWTICVFGDPMSKRDEYEYTRTEHELTE